MLLRGGYTFYRQPSIQDLLKPVSRTGNPHEFLERKAPISSLGKREESSVSKATEWSQDAQNNPDERARRQDADPISGASNREISNVLPGALRAKGLGRESSIAITNTEVIIGGLADSLEDRE